MKTIRRYTITLLVACLAFLPIVYRIFPKMPLWLQVVVGLLIALLAGFLEHYKSVRPRLALEDKRTVIFDAVFAGVLAELRKHDPTARFLIMEIDRRVLDRWSIFRNVFGRNMEGDSDKDLGLRVTQGVSGQAVARRGFCVADLEAAHGPTFNLDPGQLDKTKELTLVLSMPIKRTKKMPDGTYTLTDDIIGVVNIDSKMKGAYEFYQNTILYEGDFDDEGESLLDTQFRFLQESSGLCSYVMS